MTTTLHRPNQYAATCIRCGGHIPAGEGLLARTDTGRWAADHPADCPTTAPAAQLANTDGIYRTPDGDIYKVQYAKQGSGRLYAKRLDVTSRDGDQMHGTFTYAPGAIHNLTADMRLTADQAAAYGALYGICVCCGAALTDETSIALGIGPVCRRKYF